MKKQMLNKKGIGGITLIALVITIIVLLILAGVSIATLTGENGILTQANNSKEENRAAKVEEIKKIWETNKDIDEYTNNNTAQTLEELLNDLEAQKLINEEERRQIDENGYVAISNKNISFSDGLKGASYTITSSTDDVTFKKIIKAGDIEIEKSGYTTYSIEGIATDKNGPFETTGVINGKTGNFEIVGDIQDATFKYTLTNFMQGDEIFFIKVNIDGKEYFEEVKVIQGEKVIYQEDFVGIEYSSNWTEELAEDELYTDGKAKYVDTTASAAKLKYTFMGTKSDVIIKTNGYFKITVKDLNAGETKEGMINMVAAWPEHMDLLHNKEYYFGEQSVYVIELIQAKRTAIAGKDWYMDAIIVYR